MRRRLFNLAVAVSAFLLAVFAAAAVRGRFVADQFEYRWENETADGLVGGLWYVSATGGGIRVDRMRQSHPRYRLTAAGWKWTRSKAFYYPYVHIDGPDPRFERWGFVWDGEGWLSDEYNRQLIVLPLWSAIAASAILPSMWLWKRLRRRSSVERRCATCGYDLRATRDRCPECGAVPAEARGRIRGDE